MKKLLLPLAGLALAFTAGVTGYMFQQDRQAQPAATAAPAPAKAKLVKGIVGSQRPEFSLADVDGNVRHINEWDGKVVAINFWATWCPPCIKEIPEFVELQHRYENQGLQFVGIALQRAEEVTDFMAEHGMNYPVLAGELEVIKIAEEYGNNIGALPYTVIITRNGEIHYVKKGPLSGAEADSIISKLL